MAGTDVESPDTQPNPTQPNPTGYPDAHPPPPRSGSTTWNPRVDGWAATFEALKGFVLATHRLPSSSSSDPDEQFLARWAGTQRNAHRNKTLSQVRRDRLTNIPGWIWNTRTASWDSTFANLNEFVTRHNRVPTSSADDAAEATLGRWLVNQRNRLYLKSTSDPRRQRLEALPRFSWSRYDDDWTAAVEALGQFVAAHDRTPSQTADGPEEQFLARWMLTQRQARKNGKLSQDRRRLLEEVSGWKWDGRDDWRAKVLGQKAATWNTRFEAVRGFITTYGMSPSRTGSDPEERRLGEWVGKQRQAMRNDELSEDRRVRLESIPGWKWSAR